MSLNVNVPGEALKLALADPEYDRIDLVVYRGDDLGGREVKVITGTPAVRPVHPACPEGWWPQCTVRVPAAPGGGV